MANKITVAVAKVTIASTKAANNVSAKAVLSKVSRQRPCVSRRAPGATAFNCASSALVANWRSEAGLISINIGSGNSSPILPVPNQGSSKAMRSPRSKTRIFAIPGAAFNSRITAGNCSSADKSRVSTICTLIALVARASQRSAARSANKDEPSARQAKKLITIVTAESAGPAKFSGGKRRAALRCVSLIARPPSG